MKSSLISTSIKAILGIAPKHSPRLSNTFTTRFQLYHCETASQTAYHLPLVRRTVPEFSSNAVVHGEFQKLSNADYFGKYWVLFFYPLDFTFVCPTEIISFNDRLQEFTEIETNIVGCSIDSTHSHLAWMNTPRSSGGLGAHLKYPLLSDLDKSISAKFGVLLEEGIALRGLFIIDPKGKIRHSTINDLPIGRSVDEVLRTVKAIQFVDKFGEVCPANWKPGSDTIAPNPKDSKKYFQKTYKS